MALVVLLIKIWLVVSVMCKINTLSSPFRIYDFITESVCKARRIPLLDNIFSQSNHIYLNDPERATIFRKSWNASSLKKFSDCKFYFHAPPSKGLYLTIEKAMLRKNNQGGCIDYIVVKKSNDKKFTFCDAITNDKLRVFADNKGLRITINLDSTFAMRYKDEQLEVHLIATIKQGCENLAEFYPCKSDEEDSCISKEFFGDGVINCPECIDEKACFEVADQVQLLDPSNVLLCAVISLIATLVLSGCFLWWLYRYRHCICIYNNTIRITGNNHNSVTTMSDQLQAEMLSSNNDMQMSTSCSASKDLPPSYDSLFPVSSCNNNHQL